MTTDPREHTPLPWQSDYAGNMITDCVPSAGYTFDKVIARFQNWNDVPFVLKRVNGYDDLETQLAQQKALIGELVEALENHEDEFETVMGKKTLEKARSMGLGEK